MATTVAVGYNLGGPISGTTQFGDLAVGVSAQDYGANPGGIVYWASADEDLGYVIGTSVPSGNQPNPLSVPAYVGFYRSKFKTEESFIGISEFITRKDKL